MIRMWHFKIQKTIIWITESRVLFSTENEIPEIRKWLSNMLNKSFQTSENHFRNSVILIIFHFYEWNFKQPEIREMFSDLTHTLFNVK